MGQADLVGTFSEPEGQECAQQDATTAGAIRSYLREFRFHPDGCSWDPSCDVVHARAKQNAYKSGQVRLAVVRIALTPKATTSGVQLDQPVDVATRELVDVTAVRLGLHTRRHEGSRFAFAASGRGRRRRGSE